MLVQGYRQLRCSAADFLPEAMPTAQRATRVRDRAHIRVDHLSGCRSRQSFPPAAWDFRGEVYAGQYGIGFAWSAVLPLRTWRGDWRRWKTSGRNGDQ